MARIIFFLCLSLLWAEYEPNKVLVKLKPAAFGVQAAGAAADFSPELKNLLNGYGANNVRRLAETSSVSLLQRSANDPLSGYYAVEYAASVNVELLVEMLKNDPAVAAAQPSFLYHIMDVVPSQDGKYASYQASYMRQISAPQGWAIFTGSPDIKIAIVDTGVNNHLELSGKIIDGYNAIDQTTGLAAAADDNGHGTHVASIAAAAAGNGGMVGLDWRAKIIAVKALGADGSGKTDHLARGIKEAANLGADVINMSFGGLSSGGDVLFQEASDYAYGLGCVLVAANGNVNNDLSKGPIIKKDDIVYPAAISSVIGVGSVDRDGNPSDFSVRGRDGKYAELLAPGASILYAEHNKLSCYGRGDGTSYAAPLASALAALLKGQNDARTNQRIRTILHNTATDLGQSGYDEYYGYGVIDVYRALTETPYEGYVGSKLAEIISFPNSARSSVKFSFRIDKPVAEVEITIYDQRGRKVAVLDSGPGLAGLYITSEWDLKTDGKYLANGSYIYVLKITTTDGSISYGRNILSIVR